MTIYRVCKIDEILSATDLIEEYINESATCGLPQPSPQSGIYRMLEHNGILHSFGAFKGDNIIGFITMISTISPHYGILISVSESFFVSKKDRKTGAGIKLLRMAEKFAISIGSKGILVGAPIGKGLDKMLTNSKSGYQPSGVVFFRGFNA